MKKMLLTSVALAAAAALNTAHAGNARIDITCKDRTQSIKQVETTCRTYNHGWVKQNPDSGRTVEIPTTADWTQMKVTITPEADGVWTLNLKGKFLRGKETKQIVPVEVLYDQVEVTGAELKNGSFEAVDAKRGQPADWWANKSFAQENRYISDAEGAKDGERYVKVWHNMNIGQTLNVTAGQPVTISAYVKAAE